MSVILSVKSAVYQSQTSSIVRPYSGGKESVAIKAGDFLLNGKKIAITKGDSLKSIAEKINKLAPQTGVRARIVKKDDGYGLHLVSKNKPVGIQDPNGVLANLYSKGHIGKSSKHLIQVTGGEIFYNRPLPRSQQHSQALMDMFKVVKPHNTETNPNTLVVLNEVQDDDSVHEDLSIDYDSDSSVDENTSIDIDNTEQIQANILFAQQQANANESSIRANNLVDAALGKVIVDRGLVNTNLLLPKYIFVYNTLIQALTTKFSLDQLKTNAVTDSGKSISERLAENLDKHRKFSPFANKFKINDSKIVAMANRIKNSW